MCGISGIYNFKSEKPVSHELLKSMNDTLIHRGPDDEGFYISGCVGLGHRRLSIIDLQKGHQPMTNEDQTVWVVFNGEIYNFGELREGLIKKGHKFKTKSDTEVIVHVYEQYGERCFEYLRGMFAIAIWDARERKLILGRDRVGKKPLFYFYDGARIVFASEMKALLEVPDIPRDIDIEAVSDYFSFLYIPVPKSIFKHIRKVRPAHYLVVSDRGLRENEYWDINFADTMDLSEEQWSEKILEKYYEAVSIRMISDVPLGAFLSGGVDSSSIVGLMSNLKNDAVITSSIGFDEKEFNELDYARVVAKLFNTDHYEKIVNPDAASILEKLVWHYDEPFADSSSIPTYYVSKVAREKVTVALSGDGGDENLGGYRRYYFDKKENVLRSILPAGFRRLLFGMLASLYPKADWAPRFLRAKSLFESLSYTHVEGYFWSISAVRPPLKNILLHDDIRHALGGYDSLNVFRYYYNKAQFDDPVSKIQYLDIKTYLTDDILVKVDRASMANSLEVRAPILDHEFMELLARIPSTLKLKGKTGKYIFKKTLKDLLPQEILYRRKSGFAIPLDRWFRKELKDLTYRTLFTSGHDDYLNQATVKKIWKEHQSGLRNRSTELWTILMFKMWQQTFIT